MAKRYFRVGDASAVSVGGIEYKPAGGIVEVDDIHAAALIVHGFKEAPAPEVVDAPEKATKK